jgi:transcriptional regulator with XRE-family HTH domain
MAKNGEQSLGEKIKTGRIKSGISQQVLAGKLDVSQPLVSQWELGKAKPDKAQIEALESILGGITKEEDSPDQSLPPISIWLAGALSRKNMTAHELSKLAGISAPTVYNLLNGGAQNPQPRTLKKLEAALNEKFEREDRAIDDQGIGELVDFNPHDKADHPGKPGVYVFYDISGRPIYVGKATNISDRVDDHKDKFWFKQPIVETAAYIEIADKRLRDQVETVLIQFLKKNAVINKNKTDRK